MSPSRSHGINPSDVASVTNLLEASIMDRTTVPKDKDFSYLLRREIYHPLSQLGVSPAFRSRYPSISLEEPLAMNLAKLDDSIKNGYFLAAAHLSAEILCSSLITPTDHEAIFSLLYTRLACLDITGNAQLAAQEAKVLEDLNSIFYYVDNGPENPASIHESVSKGHAQHIVPWSLRVLAVRLQSIGFGDARRAIAGLYELGLEARKRLLRNTLTKHERTLWKERLADLGIRVVNSLIDMGDLGAARRSLANLCSPKNDRLRASRMVLLYLRIGDVGAAKELLDVADISDGIMRPMLSMAEGKYGDAVTEWESLRENHAGQADEALIAQNLSVCLLYTGRLNEVMIDHLTSLQPSKYGVELTLISSHAIS